MRHVKVFFIDQGCIEGVLTGEDDRGIYLDELFEGRRKLYIPRTAIRFVHVME